MHVGDPRDASHHARAIGVSQPALDFVFLEQLRIYGVDAAESLVESKFFFVTHGISSLKARFTLLRERPHKQEAKLQFRHTRLSYE